MVNIKTLYLNGIAVGEYESTGQDVEDIEKVRAILQEKGLYEEKTVVQSMFGQAVAFANTAKHLYESGLLRQPRDPLTFAPFVVNAAFSIELYLKTLGKVFDENLKGHQLLALYDSLPDKAYEKIENEIPKCAEKWNLDTSSDFREMPTKLNDSFVEWRYCNEKQRTGEVDIQPLIFVMNSLHEACRATGET